MKNKRRGNSKVVACVAISSLTSPKYLGRPQAVKQLRFWLSKQAMNVEPMYLHCQAGEVSSAKHVQKLSHERSENGLVQVAPFTMQLQVILAQALESCTRAA